MVSFGNFVSWYSIPSVHSISPFHSPFHRLDTPVEKWGSTNQNEMSKVSLQHKARVTSFWSPPAFKILCTSHLLNESSKVTTHVHYFVLCLVWCWIYTLVKSVHFQSRLGIWYQATFKACNLSVRLEEVPAFSSLYQACHRAARDSKPEDYSLYWSISWWRPKEGDVVLLFVLKGDYWSD